MYSDDAGSANRGGELGFVNRGDLVPEFERVAFRLQEDEISEVVESTYGFHIMQLIERRGEQINVRHILIKPKPNSQSIKDAKDEANRIINELDSGIISNFIKTIIEDYIIKRSDIIELYNKKRLYNELNPEKEIPDDLQFLNGSIFYRQ